jgi:hypothetical protein
MEIFGERVQGAITKLAERINEDIFTGTGIKNGNPALVGFFGGATDATGVYANISRATFAEWAGTVNGNGGVPRSLVTDLFYAVEQSIYTKSGQKPDLILTSPGITRKYANIFEAERRVVTDGSGSPRYESGSLNLFWNGIPVIRDRNCKPGSLVFCNTQHMDIQQLPNRQVLLAQETLRQTQLQGSNGQTATLLQLVARVTPLARLGDAIKMMVNTKLALRVRRPNTFGQLLDIDES